MAFFAQTMEQAKSQLPDSKFTMNALETQPFMVEILEVKLNRLLLMVKSKGNLHFWDTYELGW